MFLLFMERADLRCSVSVMVHKLLTTTKSVAHTHIKYSDLF